MGWKTILGSLILATATAAQGGFQKESILQGIGIFLGGIGVRDAIRKVGKVL